MVPRHAGPVRSPRIVHADSDARQSVHQLRRASRGWSAAGSECDSPDLEAVITDQLWPDAPTTAHDITKDLPHDWVSHPADPGPGAPGVGIDLGGDCPQRCADPSVGVGCAAHLR
jgi:hypothetical protein